MVENYKEIVEGVKILSHMFPNAKCYIGIEDNKKMPFQLCHLLSQI